MRRNDAYTIIVCTYNGAARLPKTLDSLAALLHARHEWIDRIIVVDNRSTDETADLVEAWRAKTSPEKLVHLYESRSGKTHAVLAALLCVRTRYAAIVDDDNYVSSEWFDLSRNALGSRPDIGVLGVKTFTRTQIEDQFPAWMLRMFAIGTQTLPHHEESGECEQVWGAGSWIDAGTVLAALEGGWRPVLLGRSNNTLVAGEDSEICHVVRLLGQVVIAHDGIQIEHDVTLDRLNPKSLANIALALGMTEPILSAYDRHGHGIDRGNKTLPGDVARVVYHSILRSISAVLGGANRRNEQNVRWWLAWGRLCSRFKCRHQIRQAGNEARRLLQMHSEISRKSSQAAPPLDSTCR